MMGFKAILFDLDNTLIDFIKLKRMCVENAVDAMIDSGLSMPKAQAVGLFLELYYKNGLENQRIFQDFSETALGYLNYCIMGAGINAYRKTKISYLEPYPHVAATLADLYKKGIKIAIVTDAGKMQAWIRIAAIRIGHLLDTVVTLDDTGKQKPNPDPFRKALCDLGVDAPDCLFVGDWVERDIEGANRVGMKTCFARYGVEDKSKKSSADYTIDDVSELLDLIP